MSAGPKTASVRVGRVDDEGIHLSARSDVVVDVLFDGRRVWSFWSKRDTTGVAQRLAAWPDALGRHLSGTATVTVVEHVSEVEVFSADVTLGEGAGRIAVVDRGGRPLALDKSGKLMRVFGDRDAELVEPLLESIGVVLEALKEVGVDAFLAYGTLLGAVRSGKLIGHDSDADLGYVSDALEPVDAIIESFRIQRALVERGFHVTRYSGIAFRVTVQEADGTARGLDVFGGLFHRGHLYLMGEVGAPFEREWIHPLGEVGLEGRTFPAPARPEKLLEAMYGEAWRVPDPAYKFTTPRETARRLTGWFRGTRGGRDLDWGKGERSAPSSLAAFVLEREPEIGTLVDVGCGRGADVVWFATHGVPAWGLDFLVRRYGRSAGLAARRGLPATFLWTNLDELRSVLPVGYELARLPGPRIVMARHVLDATDRFARINLLRLAELATRDGGRLYLQVLGRPQKAVPSLGPVKPLDVDALLELIGERRGRVIQHERVLDPALDDATVHRLVVEW